MSGSDKTKSSEQQQASTQNTIDPQELAMLQGNYAGAQGRANSLTPYTGQLTAGFNPTQTQAQGIFSGIGTDPRYAAANNNAISSAQGVLGSPINGQITPQNVNPASITAPQISGASQIGTSPVNANPVTAGLLKNTDLSPYLHPYTNDVINTSIDQNERARQMATVGDAQKATAAGAFGGSRSGVLSSLTNGEYDRNSQANIANLNAANFTQAQGAATGDINRTLGADQFNAGQDLSAKQYNSGQNYNAQTQNAANTLNAQQYNANGILSAAQSNAAAANNMGQFNATNNQNAQQSSVNNALASAGLTLNAAGQIVQLNNAALGTAGAQAGILSSVGDAQQAQQQTELTNAYNAWSQGQQLTVAQQQLLNSALGLIPNQQTVNSSGTSSGTNTTTRNPGLTDIMSAISGNAQAAAKMGVGF